MCGIAGVVMDSAAAARAGDLAGVLAHRGPDDRGCVAFDGIAPGRSVRLAHRRLAILDLSARGHQPMPSPCGRYHVVFNGEIYNYRELGAELRGHGHRMDSDSDTAVLLAAFAEWGTDALRRFQGMFALALLDTQARRLTLARDPFGIKPLYWWSDPGQFAFASEIKALVRLPFVPRRLNPRTAYDYLRFGITDHTEDTLFAGIKQLRPGHVATLDLESMAWQLDTFAEPPPRREGVPFSRAVRDVRELFLESVQLHLRSDVPVGAALSGGVDSSAIIAATRHVLGRGQEIEAFSYSSGDASDEMGWARIAAEAAGARLHVVETSTTDLDSQLDRVIGLHDEPFVGSSVLAQEQVFAAAGRAGFKVMLGGQGADELLAGYRQYLVPRAASLLRHGHPRRALQLVRAHPGLARRAAEVAALLAPASVEGAARTLVAERRLAPPWLDARWLRERGVTGEPPWRASGPEHLRAALEASVTTTSLPMLLRFEDRNSMAHAVESRVPFLHVPLADYLRSLPESYLLDSDGTSKRVFRAAMRGLVPDAILDRRDKVGFATPQSAWLRQHQGWVEGVLSSPAAGRTGLLRPVAMREAWRRELRRGRVHPAAWRWLDFIRWVELLEVEAA